MKPYRKIRTNNVDLDRVQDRVDDAFTNVLRNAIIDGVFVSASITSAATPTAINHTLSRQPLGWIIVDNTASSVVHRNDWNPRTLTLSASAPTEVKLYIF